MSTSRFPTARTQPLVEPTRAASWDHDRGSPHVDALALGRYRLLRLLGAGSYGTVWLAHDERLDRDVAVKHVPRARVIGGRFEREALAAARLSHSGIVTLYEAAVDEHGAYLVSELVRGWTFGALHERERLSDRDVVELGMVLCDALAHAHAHGVIHRDVKPANILVPESPASAASLAKLTDFGVARLFGGDTLTRTGDVVGTAAYMAPEQAAGREAGPPADLYALALVVYEGLTGANPLQRSPERGPRRLGIRLPPLRAQRRDLPRELGRGVDFALRPRAGERGTLEDLRGALEQALPLLSDEIGPLEPTRSRPRGLEPAWTAAARPAEEAPPDRMRGAPAAVSRWWTSRLVAAGASALLAGWLARHLLHAGAVSPVGCAVLAGLLVFALPRLGWLTIAAVFPLAAAGEHRAGGAVLLIAALITPMLLIPRRARAWPLVVLAPALGLLGLAGVWPALAGRARGPLTRAGLGAAGWLWLLLAASVRGPAGLYVARPPGVRSSHDWLHSANLALSEALRPLVSSGAVLPAAVWALAAMVLPWVVRRRSLTANALLALLWTVATVAATAAALGTAGRFHTFATSDTVLIGAVAAGLLALVPSFTAAWRAGGAAPGLP